MHSSPLLSRPKRSFFIRYNKKWWLTPIIVFLLLLSALIVFTEGAALSPFIYTLF